jgi:hypothetical protein
MPGVTRELLECCSVHPRDAVHTGTGADIGAGIGAGIGGVLAVDLSIPAAVDTGSLAFVAGTQVVAHCIQVSVQEQPRVVGQHSLDRREVTSQPDDSDCACCSIISSFPQALISVTEIKSRNLNIHIHVVSNDPER